MWIAAMTPWQLVRQMLWLTFTPTGRRATAADRERTRRTDPCARMVTCPSCRARFVP